MKATALLKQQHKVVEKLFKAIAKSDDDTERAQLFEELAGNLVAHDAIEREIFYPACEAKMGLNDLLGEALVEHGVIEFSLYEANNAVGDDSFDFKMTVLREMVEHHVQEEETELFPEVEKVLEKAELESLGTTMEAKFAKVLGSDFRAPLFANLQQVLAGSIKPKPKPGKRDSKGVSERHSQR